MYLFSYKKLRNQAELNPEQADYQARCLHNRVTTTVLLWTVFKPTIFLYHFYLLQYILYLNVFTLGTFLTSSGNFHLLGPVKRIFLLISLGFCDFSGATTRLNGYGSSY